MLPVYVMIFQRYPVTLEFLKIDIDKTKIEKSVPEISHSDVLPEISHSDDIQLYHLFDVKEEVHRVYIYIHVGLTNN